MVQAAKSQSELMHCPKLVTVPGTIPPDSEDTVHTACLSQLPTPVFRDCMRLLRVQGDASHLMEDCAYHTGKPRCGELCKDAAL